MEKTKIFPNNKDKGYIIKVYTTDKRTTKKKLDEGFSLKLKEAMEDKQINKISVISFVGKAGRGKSTLASLFVNYLEKLNGLDEKFFDFMFEPSRGLLTKTKDLYCYGKILKIPDTDMGVLVMDCQGDGTLPENVEEEDKERLNLEKNLFIAMSSSSVVVFFLEARYNFHDSTTLNSFQNLFDRIKNTVEISYPGMILMRNRTTNLKVEDKVKDIKNRAGSHLTKMQEKKGSVLLEKHFSQVTSDERQEYINSFVKSGNLEREMTENLFATFFPTIGVDQSISEIINSDYAKYSFDYIIEILKRYPKYLNKEKDLFMDTQALHEQIENIIEQTNNIESRNSFKNLISPITHIIKNKIKFEYSTIKQHFTKIFIEISKNLWNHTPEEIQQLISKEIFITKNLNKYEQIDKKTFDYYKNKIENFISSNLSTTCYEVLQESYIRELTQLDKEIETQKNEINSKFFNDDIEMTTIENDKKKLQNEYKEMQEELQLKNEKLIKLEKKIKMKENCKEELTQDFNSEQTRTQHVKLLQEKISKIKVELKILEENYNIKDKKLSELEFESNLKIKESIMVSNKLQRLKDGPQEEINELDTLVKLLETTKNENLIKVGESNTNIELCYDQLNKLEKEITINEAKLENILVEYHNSKNELKELQRENNYKTYVNKKNSDKQNCNAEQNKIDISCLNQDIKYLKNNENSLEEQKKNLKDELNLYKNEYPEKEFFHKKLTIDRQEREIEERKKKYTNILQFDEVEQELNNLKRKIQGLTKEKEFKHRKLDEYNADDVIKIMDEVEKEKFEREKWRIKNELSQTAKPIGNIIQELNELDSENGKLVQKIKELKSHLISQDLDKIRIKISTTHYEFAELTQRLKIETEASKIKFKNLKESTIVLRRNYSKKFEVASYVLKFCSSLIIFLNEIRSVTENFKKAHKEEFDFKSKPKLLKLLAETFYFLFSQNEGKMIEFSRKIQNNLYFKKVFSRIKYNLFELYLFNSKTFITCFKNLNDSYYKITNYEAKNNQYYANLIQKSPFIDSMNNSYGNASENNFPIHDIINFNNNENVEFSHVNDNNEGNMIDDNNLDEEFDSSPFPDDLFIDLCQETLASFSNKILFSSDGNQGYPCDLKFDKVLEILENSDKKIMTEFKNMTDSNEKPLTMDSDETPLRLIFEVLKSRTKYHLQKLIRHPKFNRLLTTFYLYTDERFRTNFNNLCGKIIELPFLVERKDGSKFINNEIINTNSNFVYFGFIPWLDIEQEQIFYTNKNNFVNELFNTNFVPYDPTLISQFRFYDVTDNKNQLFSFFLLNHNQVVRNDLIENFIQQFDVLFFFIERNNFDEFIDLFMIKLKAKTDKLFILVLNDNYSNQDANSEEIINVCKKKMKNESNFILLNIEEPSLSEDDQDKMYNFIDYNLKNFKEYYSFRKECMVNFLDSINNHFNKIEKNNDNNRRLLQVQNNSKMVNYNENNEENLPEMFKAMKKYINTFIEGRDVDIATVKKRLNSSSRLVQDLFHNDYFNLHFLKQCYYTKNILNCEVERSNPQISNEDREEYNKLIFSLNDSRMKDKVVNIEIINFLRDMSNKSKGNFITKFYLFTTLLKSTFISNLKLKQISDQFSFEHLLREIYYSKILHSSFSQNSNNLKQNDENLLENIDNNILSDLVQSFQPFEIVDGDSLKFSLDNSNITLGDKFNKNIFIVSIVGPQSTGKSTLNNQIFSVDFQTSQGRCSRGIYGALIPIKENSNFQYILALDTEGIDAKENKHDKLLTRRLLLFILKVSHVILLSPGSEMKAHFYDEFIMSCNNYLNSHQNILPKPLIKCLFNMVGAHRHDEIQSVFSVWKRVLFEKLYSDSENNFREYDINTIFDFDSAEAIPYAFEGKSLNLLKNCNSNTFRTAFNNKINSIRQVILSRLNDLNIQPITLDGWLKAARHLWNEISQIKSLNIINHSNDIKTKHKLNDLLIESKNDIMANSNKIETSIIEFKNKMSEDDKCSIEKLIQKFKDFSYKQCEDGKELIISSFLKKIKRYNSGENYRIPEQLINDKIRQIEKMFKLIELDYQLLSYREIQKELRFVLLIGKSDFHKNLRVEAYNLREKLVNKQDKKIIEEYFENYFIEKSMYILNNLDIIHIDTYFRDVYYYVILKADLNFDADHFEYLFTKFNSGNETCNELKKCFLEHGLHMLSPIDKFKLNPANYSNSARSYCNPYVKILNIIKNTNKVILPKKTILENINYNYMKEQFRGVIASNRGYIKKVGQFFNLTPTIENEIISIMTYLQNDFENLGYILDNNMATIIILVFKTYLHLSEDKLLDMVIGHLKQMDKFMKPFKPLDTKIIPKLEFMLDGIYNFLNSNNGCYELENNLNNEHNERYIRGLKLYFENSLFNVSYDPHEVNKFTSILLCSDYVLNIKSVFEDINSKIFDIFGIEKTFVKNIKEYEDFFFSINPDPFSPKNVEKLIKNEYVIAKTFVLDHATLTLLFQEIEKIFNIIRDGYRIYGFEINDYFKFYLYAFTISNATLISFYNYRLKSLTLLIEFHKNKNEMKEEFYCIISNNYDQLNTIAVNNIFKRFVSELEGCATEFAIEKYRNEMNLKGGNISSVNKRKKEIEDKIMVDKPLTHDEKQFYLKMLTNPDEIYQQEFQKIWDILDGTVKQECGNVYAKKINHFIEYFEQILEEMKKDFNLDIFRRELHETISFVDPNSVKGNAKDLQAKGLFIIFKSYILSINQLPDKIQVDNNIEIKFNSMRLPMINLSIFNSFPADFKEILRLVFLNDERIFNINMFIISLEDLFLKYKSRKELKNKNLDMTGLKNKMKLKYLECIVPCPFCNRKCDEVHETNDKMIHHCSCHQYRIFAGIKLSCNLPSFMFCDKIENDSMIEFNGIKKSWEEIKRDIYNNYKWEFSSNNNLNNIDNNENLLIKVWKIFGQAVCDYYNNTKNLNVTYINYEDFIKYRPKNHYIFMLDYSGSMKGQRWKSVKDSFNNVMISLYSENNNIMDNTSISVGIFGSTGEKQIIAKEIQPKIDLLVHLNNPKMGTDYGEAFTGILDMMNYHPEAHDEIVVLFMTDGEANYPANVLNRFNNNILLKKTSFHILYYTDSQKLPGVLKQIADYLKPISKFTSLSTAYNPTELNKKFVEIIKLDLNLE